MIFLRRDVEGALSGIITLNLYRLGSGDNNTDANIHIIYHS